MKYGSLLRPAAFAVAAAFVVGCAAEAPTTFARVPDASLGFIPGLPTDPTVTERTAQPERVEVCKDFVMTSGAPAPAASFKVNNNPFSLTDHACKEAWVRDGGENVLVEETPTLDGFITTIKVTSTTGSVTNVNGTSTSVALFGTVGFLLEFVNTEEVNTGGCSLTQGYWKTHSTYGPAAKPDAIWASVGGPDAAFYTSGYSWYGLFWTPPKGGNVYIQLAHQFMAATLNVNNGASTTAAVAAALSGANTFFSTVAGPNTALTNTQKNNAKAWATTLGSYNEGTIGPGHC